MLRLQKVAFIRLSPFVLISLRGFNPHLPSASSCVVGVERQGEPAAPPAAGAGTVQGRRQNDPASAGGGEKSVSGAHGHPGGDGGLRLRGAATESPAAGDQAALLHAETRYDQCANYRNNQTSSEHLKVIETHVWAFLLRAQICIKKK